MEDSLVQKKTREKLLRPDQGKRKSARKRKRIRGNSV